MVGRIPVPHQVQCAKARLACRFRVQFYVHYCSFYTAMLIAPQSLSPLLPPFSPPLLAYSINTVLERSRSPQKSEAGQSTPATPARAYSPRVRSRKSSKPSEVRSIDYPIYQFSAQIKSTNAHHPLPLYSATRSAARQRSLLLLLAMNCRRDRSLRQDYVYQAQDKGEKYASTRARKSAKERGGEGAKPRVQ